MKETTVSPVDLMLNAEQVAQTFRLFTSPEGVIEIRALKAGTNKRTTLSGYFEATAESAFVTAVRQGSKQNPSGIYATLNPAMPALLSRCANRLDTAGEGVTTKDAEILRRRWILIDADALRPAGLSASDDEHCEALAVATRCHKHLLSSHDIQSVLADSGNGGHVLVPVDLPNNADSDALVKAFLKALAEDFDTEAVKIDQGVFNAGRISKIYGTLTRKGDNTTMRPHRYSRLLNVPALDLLTSVPESVLRGLAGVFASAPSKRPSVSQHADATARLGLTRFDVPAFLAQHALMVHSEKPGSLSGWYHWNLEHCPFNPDHQFPDAFIGQHDNGALKFHCRHNSCQANDWQELRALLEPGWRPYEPNRHLKQKADLQHEAATEQAEEADTEDNAGRGAASLQADLHEKLAGFSLTDLGNAERLVKRHGRNLRFVHTWGKWLCWDGRRWKVDDRAAVVRMAKHTARQIYAEAATIPVQPDDEKSKARVAALAAWAKKSESKDRLTAMLYLAQSEALVSVTHEDLDASPWLLNVENGVLNLQTGQLSPHKREALMTKISEIAFNPSASCPRWLAFLDRVLPDLSVRDYVRRCAGYTLTGSVSEQCIFFLYGGGKNGKSVFTGILEALLGDFWSKTRAETLMHKREQGGIPNDIAALCGKRLATISEINDGQRLNEGLIKDLSGGDTMQARFLHQEFFNFKPTFKIWIYGNHRPQVRGTDEGIWRRLRTIPFEVTISEEEKDTDLPDKLREELPGILAWAVQGCLEWQKRGLSDPDQVRKATQEYRSEMDNVEQFLADRCTTGKDLFDECAVFCGTLYSEYKGWCELTGEHPCSLTAFGKNMTKKGYEKSKKEKGKQYLGIRLLAPDELEERDKEETETRKVQDTSKTDQSCTLLPNPAQSAHFAEVFSINSIRDMENYAKVCRLCRNPQTVQESELLVLLPLIDMVEAAQTNDLPTGEINLMGPKEICYDINFRVKTAASAYQTAREQGKDDLTNKHLDMLQRCFNVLHSEAAPLHLVRTIEE